MPLNPNEGGYTYNGNDYLARIVSENFSVTQARSADGIDRIPAITLKLADPDYFLWLSYEMQKGFCGAIMTASLILMDISSTTGAYLYTSDAPLQFVGICDPPNRENDGSTMTLSAQSSHNMGKVYQPYVQVQQRCPWVFPVGPAQRLQGGTDPSSNYWFCGYDPDQAGTDPEIGGSCIRGNTTTANLTIDGTAVTDAAGIYIACDYTKSGTYGCVAHGMYTADSAGRQTGRFGGEQWAPTTLESRSKSYTTGKQVTVFSATNQSIYTDRFPMLYGIQWVIPPVVINELGDANSTRGEATICMGNIGTYGILQVVLNSIIVPRNNAGNPLGPSATPTDPLQRWNFTGGGTFGYAYGSRNGNPTDDAGFNDSNGVPQGDPHGSHATIEWVVYSELLQSTSLPSMMVLANGPAIWVWQNPTTKVLQVSDSPAWAVMDLLIHSNWSFAELDIQSFITAAQVCFVNVNYVNLTGANAVHQRFLCQMVVHQRRTAQEVIQMVLRCFNAQLVPNSSTGLLQLIVRQTLADQQASPIAGSNFNTPIQSIPGNASQASVDTYEGGGSTGSSGYVAWMFDESSIYRPSTAAGDAPPRLRVYSIPNLQRPNEVTFPFQDMDNSYVQDSLTLDDEEAINRAGGYNGAVLNTQTYQVLGISNFDQAIRIANVYLAEQNHGNPEGDARGTYYFELESTVRIEHLRVGQIVLVQNQSLGMNGATPLQSPPGTEILGFLARVISIAPTTDFERSTCQLAWHEDIWYTDVFGQAPAPFYSAQARGIPARPPFAWSPYGQQPIAGDAMWPASDWGFGISQSYTLTADGGALCIVSISGCPPVNKFATVLPPPLIPIQGTTSATGGSISGGQSIYLMLSGIDVSGLYTPLSQPCLVNVPAGTNTNTITLPSIYWPVGTTGWVLYGGLDQQRFCEQTSGTGDSIASIQLNSLNVSTYGAPDPLAASMYFRWKREIHGGIWGEQVDVITTGQLTFTGANFGSSGWTGRIVSLIANPAGSLTNIPIQDFLVTSSSGNVLTVTPDPLAAGVPIGAVFVMRTQPTTFTSKTIGDSGFVNGFSTGLTPGAEVGNLVRIIAYGNAAMNQTRTIVSNTSTVLTVDTAFDIAPTAGSTFVVLESTWQGSYDVPYTSATLAPSPPPVIANLNVTNFKSETIFIEGMVEDATGNTALEYFCPWRELYVWGSAGTPGGSTIAPLTLTYSGNVGNVGSPFSGACVATGGVPGTTGYVFALPSGNLPPGLTLNTGLVPATKANAGQVSGTPTTVEYNLPYVFTVTDTASSVATTTGTISILPNGVAPFSDVVTGLTLTVSFRATGSQGAAQFQVAGKFTPPVDSAYAYSIAGLFVVGASGTPGTSANPGGPLAAAIAPAVNSWNGPWYDVPAASTQYMVYVWCINVNGLQSTANTNTSASPITISLAIAQAYINGGTTVVGAEIPNCTLSNVQIAYNLGNTADGVEGYNVVGTGTTPNDPRFASGQMTLCPMGLFTGYNSTVGASIPATGSPLNVYVSPYGVAGSCTVATDGITVTGITPPVAPGLAGNFTIINAIIYQVASWVSSSSVLLLAGSAAPSGAHNWYSIECRYGMTVGDIVQIDNEQFVLTGPQSGYILDQVIEVGGTGVSPWVLTRIPGQTFVSHTSGGGKLIVDVASTAGNVDDYAGSLLPGTTTSVSPNYPIGLPVAYIAYLVSLSTDGLFNTWPVVGLTPSFIIGAVEAQTTGNLQPSRLTPTQFDGTMALVNGRLVSLVPTGSNQVINGTFSAGYNPGTTIPKGWNWTGPASAISVTNGVEFVPGQLSAELTGNGQFYTQTVPGVAPGVQYGMQIEFSTGTSANGNYAVQINFYTPTGAYISYGTGAPITGTLASFNGIWGRIPSAANTLLVSTAPAGASLMAIVVTITGMTTGYLCIANATLQTLTTAAGVALTPGGPLGADGNGNLTVFTAGPVSSSGGVISITPASLTIGYFPAGTGTVTAGYWVTTPLYPTKTQTAGSGLPALPNAAYPLSSIIFNEYNARTYINTQQVWVDKGDPGDIIAGTVAAGVIYAGTVNAAQLNAGTVAVALTLTAPTIVVTGSTFTVNIDTTNGVKVANSSSGNTVSLSGGGVSITYAGTYAASLLASAPQLTISYTSGTTASFQAEADAVGTTLTLQNEHGSTAAILSGSYASGAYLLLSPSTNAPGGTPGLLYVTTAGHLMFYYGGSYVQIV